MRLTITFQSPQILRRDNLLTVLKTHSLTFYLFDSHLSMKFYQSNHLKFDFSKSKLLIAISK